LALDCLSTLQFTVQHNLFFKMVAVDVDAMIAEFLANAACSSLKLEHMTTGQRKNLKKLVAEDYPALRCESFGFGQERQLHLFKKSVVEAEESPATTADVSPSSQGKLDVVDSPGCSTAASGNSPSGSPTVSHLQSVELQVRNTFIHMENPPVDKRAVQSMPHGMFRQCLLEAVKAKLEDEIPEFPSTPSSVSSEPGIEQMTAHAQQHASPFSIGSLVVVEGLVKLPAFNGRSAVVEGFNDATGRYDIVLASTAGSQHAKIKEENLRLVLPCP